MELNSNLFECKVVHNRLLPKKHAFSYGLFTFAIDLDELELLDKKLFFFWKSEMEPFFLFLV
jgi:DUF1365 family protein